MMQLFLELCYRKNQKNRKYSKLDQKNETKYVNINCWDRLPQNPGYVNKNIKKHVTFGRVQENTRKTLAKR